VVVLRDFQLEKTLQTAMDSGANIWVIGDVHGHFKTLESLIEQLSLNEQDIVVLLGDLIDRGPTSADVVRFARTTPNVYALRGNHEQMMIDGFDDALFFKESNEDARIWYHNGGKNTESSYMFLYGDDGSACEKALVDVKWMESLPTEIVLNDWRFVHAGYNQYHDVEGQPEEVHLWIRGLFFNSKHAIDPQRTILFGHTVTFTNLHNDDSKAGRIWSSDVLLEDGRPMAIGLDTCLYHSLPLPKVLAAYNIQTNKVIYQNKI